MNFTCPVSLTVQIPSPLLPPPPFAPLFAPPPPTRAICQCLVFLYVPWSVYVSCCDAIHPSWSWFGATPILLIHADRCKICPQGQLLHGCLSALLRE